MRKALWSALIACIVVPVVVVAQDPFIMGDELKAKVERDCADGCVIFTREHAAAFEQQLELILGACMQQAFDAGVQHQREACPALI